MGLGFQARFRLLGFRGLGVRLRVEEMGWGATSGRGGAWGAEIAADPKDPKVSSI